MDSTSDPLEGLEPDERQADFMLCEWIDGHAISRSDMEAGKQHALLLRDQLVACRREVKNLEKSCQVNQFIASIYLAGSKIKALKQELTEAQGQLGRNNALKNTVKEVHDIHVELLRADFRPQRGK